MTGDLDVWRRCWLVIGFRNTLNMFERRGLVIEQLGLALFRFRNVANNMSNMQVAISILFLLLVKVTKIRGRRKFLLIQIESVVVKSIGRGIDDDSKGHKGQESDELGHVKRDDLAVCWATHKSRHMWRLFILVT